MHAEAMEFLKRLTLHGDVLEIGSRNVNGSARDAFPDKSDMMDWVGVDIIDGPGVHIVKDATDETWRPLFSMHNVICCEVLEHCKEWPKILQNAWHYLTANGVMIITCAGPGRQPHSAIDGGPLLDGEYYQNISAEELRAELIKAGFRTVYADQSGTDTRAIAVK